MLFASSKLFAYSPLVSFSKTLIWVEKMHKATRIVSVMKECWMMAWRNVFHCSFAGLCVQTMIGMCWNNCFGFLNVTNITFMIDLFHVSFMKFDVLVVCILQLQTLLFCHCCSSFSS